MRPKRARKGRGIGIAATKGDELDRHVGKGDEQRYGLLE